MKSRDKDAKSNADIWGGSGLTPKMGKRVPKKGQIIERAALKKV